MKLNEEKIINYLNEHEGRYITSYMLVRDADAYEGDLKKIQESDKMDIETEVFRIAEENGFELNKKHHGGALIGMPYNIDFKINKRK